MQMWTRIFIACAYVLIFTVCNDAQTLVAINITAFCNLEVVKVPIFCDPAIAMINFHVAAGYFKNSPSRRRSDPEIGCIHANKYVRIGGKVHRAAHLIIVRAGFKSLGAIVKPVHGNPGFSLRPGQLEHIRWRSCCEQRSI
jgi:hypothetical protein